MVDTVDDRTPGQITSQARHGRMCGRGVDLRLGRQTSRVSSRRERGSEKDGQRHIIRICVAFIVRTWRWHQRNRCAPKAQPRLVRSAGCAECSGSCSSAYPSQRRDGRRARCAWEDALGAPRSSHPAGGSVSTPEMGRKLSPAATPYSLVSGTVSGRGRCGGCCAVQPVVVRSDRGG